MIIDTTLGSQDRGGYPERDGGAEEEEGQGWGDSRRLLTFTWNFMILIMSKN